MLRPIQVAPLSQRRMISPDPLVPNNMTQEQFIANQMAGNNVPLVQPTQQPPVQAPSPTARLSQLGQQGLQTAERFAKSITQSPAVQGLLGGGAQANQAGLLGDVQNQADLQGLFATLQAMGRPVRRGEDRFLGAVEYGRGVQQQARQQGLQDMQTRLELENLQRERDRKARQDAMLNQAQQVQVPQEMMEQVSYLPEQNQQLYAQSLRNESLAQQYASAGMLEEAQTYADLAKANRESAFAGQFDPAKRVDTELSQAKEFQKTEYQPRYALVNAYNEMVEQAKAGGGISDYALLIKYIKTLDPTSVVREGEVTMTDQFKGYEAQFNEALKRAKGQGFDEAFRNSVLDSARRQAELAASEYEMAVRTKAEQLAKNGLRPDRVITYPTIRVAGQGRSPEEQAADAQAVDDILNTY